VVGKQLDLDVPRPLQLALDIDRRVAERRASLGAGSPDGRRQIRPVS